MNTKIMPTTTAANVVSLDKARYEKKVREHAPLCHETANLYPKGSDRYEFWRALARDDIDAIDYYGARLRLQA